MNATKPQANNMAHGNSAQPHPGGADSITRATQTSRLGQPQRQGDFRVMRRLLSIVAPLSGFLALAAFLGVLGHIAATAIGTTGAYAVARAYADPAAPLAAAIAAMICLAVLRGVLRYGEQMCNHYVAFRLLALIRSRVFGALRRQGPAAVDGKGAGDFISLITSDIELLEVFYAHTISPVCIAVVYGVVACVFLGSIAPAFAILAVCAYLVVGFVLPLVIARMGRSAGSAIRGQHGGMASFVLDSLRALGETIQYDRGRDLLERLDAKSQHLTKSEEKLQRSQAGGQALTSVVIAVFDLAMLAMVCFAYSAGGVDVAGALMAFVTFVGSFGPVSALASLGGSLHNTLAAGRRVLAVLQAAPATPVVTGRNPVEFDGASMQNVTFAYTPDALPVLRGVSLTVPKGSVTAITGPSGVGKSTTLRLLMRFWDPQRGVVSVSGRDIRDLNTSDLRRVEAFVAQDTQLFHDTVRANLLIAKPDATDEELERACRQANIHDTIMALPHGYDSQVGELGDTLSAGEKQRLGLARAFLHGADLLLLDEPTSNLDALNEAQILRSLAQDQERSSRTVVLVSHRPSTTRIADTVLRMDGGAIVDALGAPAGDAGVGATSATGDAGATGERSTHPEGAQACTLGRG